MYETTKHTEQVDTHSYKGWMNSDHLWKRVLGVYGHSLVGGIVMMVIMLIAGMFA